MNCQQFVLDRLLGGKKGGTAVRGAEERKSNGYGGDWPLYQDMAEAGARATQTTGTDSDGEGRL